MSPANKSILRAVARSFYLSIRFLPTRLREPVALGYLLARSTDTVADTATVPVKTRIETLGRLSEIIQGKTSGAVAGIGDPGHSKIDNYDETKLAKASRYGRCPGFFYGWNAGRAAGITDSGHNIRKRCHSDNSA